ncbi:hypothetical protein AB0B50_37020 [Streptomyces sp. NPDC041068]|uniref:hypothetical protein n=1 Tax=Streptomyces sp. NPDC041068 TaxID=3155130 RepID=UPI0033D3531B
MLNDNREFIRATDDAIVRGNPKSSALRFYAKGDALKVSVDWVQQFVDAGQSVSGTVRYYNRKVTFLKDDSAGLTYCGDETKAYNKDRETGKRSDGVTSSSDAYVFYNLQLEKDSKGVWQTEQMMSKRGGGGSAVPLSKTANAAKCGLVIGALTATIISSSPVAFAAGRAPGNVTKPGSQGGQPTGERRGQEIGAKITYNLSRNGAGGSVGAIQPVGDWTPPLCWFAPKYTPAQYNEDSWSVGGDQAEWVKKEKKQFEKGKPDEEFHLKDKDDGYWWGHFINRDRMDETAAWECMFRDPWWVKKGDDPKVEHAISPEILAGLAYEKIRVPDTSVSMKPEGA